MKTSSQSDNHSDVVRFLMGAGALSLLATITLLLAFQFIDHRVSSASKRAAHRWR